LENVRRGEKPVHEQHRSLLAFVVVRMEARHVAIEEQRGCHPLATRERAPCRSITAIGRRADPGL
jgi:hypothetical protein